MFITGGLFGFAKQLYLAHICEYEPLGCLLGCLTDIIYVLRSNFPSSVRGRAISYVGDKLRYSLPKGYEVKCPWKITAIHLCRGLHAFTRCIAFIESLHACLATIVACAWSF